MLICLKLENIHLQILREICSIYLEVNAGICFLFFFCLNGPQQHHPNHVFTLPELALFNPNSRRAYVQGKELFGYFCSSVM